MAVSRPDSPFCGSPNPGISPNPMTSATGSPNTAMAAAFSRRNSLVSTKASMLKPFICRCLPQVSMVRPVSAT